MAIGNDFAKGFQYLERLFGERNFRVRNMDDNMVSQLANQDGRVIELIVVEPADDSKPGVYLMRTVSQETHSRHQRGVVARPDASAALLLKIGYPNDRSGIGRWLTSMDCNVYTAERSLPSLYGARLLLSVVSLRF